MGVYGDKDKLELSLPAKSFSLNKNVTRLGGIGLSLLLFRKLRQDDGEFKACLGCTLESRASLGSFVRPCLKTQSWEELRGQHSGRTFTSHVQDSRLNPDDEGRGEVNTERSCYSVVRSTPSYLCSTVMWQLRPSHRNQPCAHVTCRSSL